jgi:putative MATE family efflux protein
MVWPVPGPSLRSPHDRAIARLAIPAFGTLVAEPLYVLTDTAVVGRLGTTELAGLAVASTVLLTAHSLLIFLAYGTTATVARLIGADRRREASEVGVGALWLAAALGVVLAGAMAPGVQPLLHTLGAQGPVLTAGLLYLRISLIGFPFLLVMMAGAGTFHGHQDTRTPLAVAITSAVANLVIELVLIYGFDQGLGASAVATVVAQAGAAVVYVTTVARRARSVGAGLGPDRATIAGVLRTGRPLVIRTAALRGSFTLSTAVAARIGPTELAAHHIALQWWSTLALALDAVAVAGQALTGRWLGAGDKSQARAAADRMVHLDVGLGLLAGAAVAATGAVLAPVFSPDPAVIEVTAHLALWVGLTQPVGGLVFALDGILIGAGDLAFLARAMVASALVFALWAAGVVATGAGVGWLWAGLTVFMVVRGLVMVGRYRSDRWMVTGLR